MTFSVNGNITTIQPLDIKKGDKASKPTAPTPESGKSIGYWASVMGTSNTDYGNNLFDFDATPINEDIILYAVWQEKPADRAALITLIEQAINDQGNSPNLNFIDTGLITDMNDLFRFKTTFNGKISGWDTSKVTNMSQMFYYASAFNQDIGNWNTSKVINMANMFKGTDKFNQDIGNWNTSKVTNMAGMFSSALAFNQNIGNWNTSEVTKMDNMFNSARVFNQNIGNWNTSKVTNMAYLFKKAIDFNQNISGWIVDQVTEYVGIFDNSGITDNNYLPVRFRN